ncbi:MAG: ABC transporter ATP-binding protein [Alphaproteobacteria bacterium]|nr:ABC transporter ATP-binding protein [Alphaproteobacteria bacterium]
MLSDRAGASEVIPGTRDQRGPLLEVKALRTHFSTADGNVPAVDGVSFALDPGETLGVVGESGSGKSVMARSIMRLVQTPPGRYVSGEIVFEGEDLLKKSAAAMTEVRGNRIAMIFQEPMTSLNPVLTIGYQIAEALRLHGRGNWADARNQAVALLQRVRIADPRRRARDYPHQLSGGMRQRAMIAMALACRPRLLIADEPTTALDVTIQAQILGLMRELKADLDMSMILVTHNLGIVADIADRVLVMYAGKIVEAAPVARIFDQPLHPYTVGLLGSIPKLRERVPRLAAIAGTMPRPTAMPGGCRFHPRCPHAMPICGEREPPERQSAPGHRVSCWLHAGETS